MNRTRIGELLGRMVPLSIHDVEEILHEQRHRGRRFGQIAMELGMCRPEHIRRACAAQLNDMPQPIVLEENGIDGQSNQGLHGFSPPAT